MPGTGVSQKYGERISNADTVEGAARANRGSSHAMVCVDSVVTYRTIFDGPDTPLRITSIRHIIVPDLTQERQAERRTWLDQGPISLARVKFAQEKGAPIQIT